MSKGYTDVVHNFVEQGVPTMYKTPQFPPWRPDKVVMESVAPGGGKPHWHCVSTQIVGADARPIFA